MIPAIVINPAQVRKKDRTLLDFLYVIQDCLSDFNLAITDSPTGLTRKTAEVLRVQFTRLIQVFSQEFTLGFVIIYYVIVI